MPKITLKLQDLHKGETSLREFESEDAAVAFLHERPRFTDVLGVVFEGLSSEQNARLKAAMRPLDVEERAAEAKLAEAATKAAEIAAVARRLEEEAAHAAHRAAMKNADPNRTMELRYHYAGGVSVIDQADTREINEETRAAIEAWIVERNEWVESRNQVVGEAKLSVWPGVVPKGADRVHAGSFIPVTAPAKSSAS
jgi:hypothetical protein